MRGHGAWWLDGGRSRYILSNTNLSTIGWMYYKPIKVPLISIKTNTFNYANHTILREVEAKRDGQAAVSRASPARAGCPKSSWAAIPLLCTPKMVSLGRWLTANRPSRRRRISEFAPGLARFSCTSRAGARRKGGTVSRPTRGFCPSTGSVAYADHGCKFGLPTLSHCGMTHP